MPTQTKWILIIAIVFTTLIVSVVFMPTKGASLPDEISGVWTTTDPRYRDRFLELDKATVIFGIGSYNINVYFISEVEKISQGKSILYTIYYHNREGMEDKLSFYYNPVNNGSIRLKNKKHIVWTKSDEKMG